MPRSTWGLGLVMGVTLFVGACSGEGRDSTSDAGPETVGQLRTRVVAAGQPAGVDRQVVHTGDLVVQVDNAAGTTDAVAAVATDAGGYVFSQDVNIDGDEARLVLKVPAADFDAALDEVGAVGEVLRRTTKAEDVTEEVVDLDGRLATARASADRLRALLAGAASTADVVAIEAELAKRETEIESMQGRLRVLSDRVQLATINVRLTEENDLEVSDDVPGFLAALEQGWVVLLNVGLVALAAIGFMIPFVPFAAAGVFVVRRIRRRRAPATTGEPPEG